MLIFSDSKAAHQIWTQNTVGCLLEACMTNRSRFWIEICPIHVCLERVNSHGDTTSRLFSVGFFLVSVKLFLTFIFLIHVHFFF